MALYPYDPEGNLPSNRVTGTLSVKTFPNKFNVMVPLEAPFFRTDFKLVKNGVTLIEGIDYYLVYYYKAAADALRRPVFGGVLPISGWEDADYEMRVLGGEHTVPRSEIGRYLNRDDITDPRSVDWSALQRYPTYVTPIEPPKDFEEAIIQDPVVAALVKIKEALGEAAPVRDELFERLFNEIAITEDYYNANLLEIHVHGEHDHKYSAEDVGALRRQATALDALKSYGYTLAQMVDTAKEHGISEVQVAELVDKNMGLIWGAITNDASGKVIKVTTHSGNVAKRPEISLGGSVSSLKGGDKESVIRGSEGGWFGAGLNAIVLPKVNDAGVRPVLNGYYILTPTDVARYLTPASVATLRATVRSTPTVTLFGDGTTVSPIYGRVNPPNAAANVDGLSTVVNSWGQNLPAVVSQKLMSDTIDSLSGFALKTIRINGVAFGDDGNVVVGADTLQLGNVNNTSPAEKPVTTALTTELNKKALSEHEHAPSDLTGSVVATATKVGIGKIGSQGFALAEDVEEFLEEAEGDIGLIDNALPAWASSGLYYGDGSYLPAPVYGSYVPVGFSSNKVAVEFEANRVVFLLPSADYFGSGVYYCYGEIDRAGTIAELVPTTKPYTPKYVEEAHVTDVVSGYGGVMLVKDSDGVSWVVRTFGTMDESKHIASKLVEVDGYYINDRMNPWKLIVVGDIVLMAGMSGSNDIRYRFWQFNLDQIGVDASITPVEYNVSFTDIYGNRRTDTNEFSYAPVAYSTDPNEQPLVLVKPNPFTLPKLVTSRAHWVIYFVDDAVKIYGFSKPAYTDGTTRRRENDFAYKFELNTKTREIDIVKRELYPIVFSDKGWELTEFIEPGIGFGGHGEVVYYYNGKNTGLNFVHNDNSISVNSRRHTNATYDDIFNMDVAAPRVIRHHSTNYTVRPSTPAVHFMRQLHMLNNDTFTYQDRTNGHVEIKVDTAVPYPGYRGFGPTNSRKVIQASRERFLIPRNGPKSEHRGLINIVLDSNADVVLNTRMSETGVMSDPRKVKTSDFNDYLMSVADKRVYSRYPNATITMLDHHLYILGDPDNPDMVMLLGNYHVDNNGSILAVFSYHAIPVLSYYDNSIGLKPDMYDGIVEINTVPFLNTTRGSDDTLLQTQYSVDSEGFRGYFGTVDGYRQPGSTTRITARISRDPNGVWYSGRNNSHAIRMDSLYIYHPSLGWGRAVNTVSRDTIIFRPLRADTAAGFVGSEASTADIILLSTRPPEGWNIFITQEYPFYAEGKIYTLPIVDYDLRELFPANYQNRTFYIHVRSDGTKAWYTIDVNKLPDTASRLNVGFVKTDHERITELVVESTRRFGAVGALVRHEANRFAHDSSPDALLKNSQYSELKNMGMVDGFTLPTFKDIFDSWYRFSHRFNNVNVYPANAGELNRWVYDDTNDSIRCTVNSATYVGFISNDMVGDYVFNTVLTSNDGDNDSITVIPAAFKQGDIDNREHTISVMVDHTLNEEHHKPGSHIRVWDNYGQHDQRSIAVLDARRFSVPWSGRYAHVYVRRTGNKLFVAVKAQPLPSENLNPRNIQPLVDNLKHVTEQQMLVSGSGYVHATIDLAVEAPRFARASRYGYGCWSQLNSMYWNIQRPGADLSNFYASEETLRLSMRRDPITYRLIHGKIAPLTITAEDGNGGVIQNHSRFDNYGDVFWPIAQSSGYSALGGLRGIAPGYQYRRDGRDGTDRWFLAKVRFSLPNDGQLSIRSFADDVGRFWLASDVGVSGISPDYNLANGTTVNVAGKKGNYSLLFLIAEQNVNVSPSYFTFEVKLDGVVICSSNDDTTKAITLPRGTSVNQPTFPDRNKYTVPSAIRIPYNRPEGTAISVSVNRHYGDKRAQIDTNANFTPINLDMTEHGMNGVVIETTSQNGRLVDNIYIHQPHNAGDANDVTYQIRVTKI